MISHLKTPFPEHNKSSCDHEEAPDTCIPAQEDPKTVPCLPGNSQASTSSPSCSAPPPHPYPLPMTRTASFLTGTMK